MAYKDELTLLLGLDIKDKLSKKEKEAENLKKKLGQTERDLAKKNYDYENLKKEYDEYKEKHEK